MGTTVSGMTFYESQFETGVWLGLTQYIDAFNAASGGAILLEPGARKGRKPVQTIVSDVSGLIQSRAPSGTSTKTPTTFSNAEHRAIKLFRTAPMEIARQDWIDMGLSTAEGTRLFGEQFGAAQAQDYLNAAISALVGSITAVGTTAVLDIQAESPNTPTFGALNRTLGKLGDRRSAVRTLVAHSVSMQNLIGTAFSSQQIAFQVGPTTITNGMVPAMGLREVTTDSSALYDAGTSASTDDTYYTLALVPGAVVIRTGPQNQLFSPITGASGATPENQRWLLSVEYEFEIAVKGVSYKSASTDNPNNAALATSTNWTMFVTDRKLGPGALLKSR